jgi:hypothetical protein
MVSEMYNLETERLQIIEENDQNRHTRASRWNTFNGTTYIPIIVVVSRKEYNDSKNDFFIHFAIGDSLLLSSLYCICTITGRVYRQLHHARQDWIERG